MPKFLNKNELVLLALILLLFDISGFCATVFPYIVNGKGSIIMIIITMLFVIYSIYVYHSISNTFPPYSVQYTPTHEHTGVPSCEDEVEELLHHKNSSIDEMKKICLEKHTNSAIYFSEKIVLTIIILILFVFTYIGIFKVYDVDGNTKSIRALRAIPMILIILGIFIFTHIYVPFFSKIHY
jgi:hypothetical protein